MALYKNEDHVKKSTSDAFGIILPRANRRPIREYIDVKDAALNSPPMEETPCLHRTTTSIQLPKAIFVGD